MCWAGPSHRLLPLTPSKLFIVGCARSGTSWVRSMVEQGPVVGGPESHLFPTLYAPLVAPSDADGWRDGVLEAFDARVAEQAAVGHQGPHRWISREALVDLLDEARATRPTRDAAARMVLGSVLVSYFHRHRRSDDVALVEKTPRHLYYADKILQWWPEARVVEVVRDGRDVAMSLRAKSRWRAWAPSELHDQATRWAEAVRVGRRLAAEGDHASRWLTLRYEDLAADAPSQILRLFEFLGIAVDGGRATEIAEATTPDQTRRPFDVHHVRSGGSGAWRSAFTDTERLRFDAVAGAELRALGYEP